jgi:hypothetical protein
VDASGAWTGTWKVTGGNVLGSGAATMQLSEQGTTLTGPVSLMGTPCLTAAQLVATISPAGAFSGTLNETGVMATITGQVTGNTMTATVTNTGSACLNESGAISLVR